MAKIVSTKIGDRRLVHLPPVNFQQTRTPDVDTLAPPERAVQDHHRQHERPPGVPRIVPKDYSYRGTKPRPLKVQTQYPDGNLVTEKPEGGRFGDRIFHQLLDEANARSLQGYPQGQYPVVPPVSGAPNYMQYTEQGLASLAQQQPPLPQPGQQPYPSYNQAPPPQFPGYYQPQSTSNPVMPPAPYPTPVTSFPGHNPNERHIYYGPNGEILPGPPPGVNPQYSQNTRDYPEDFAIEGLLHHGRLTSVLLVEASRGFPKIPDYLIKDLFEKYRQFEKTVVRIVVRRGQAYVHASPDVGVPPPGGAQPEYVPVYLEDDEEFDYETFLREYQTGRYRDGVMISPRRRYGNPAPIPRSYPSINYRDDGRYSPDIRPSTEDPISHLRWQKSDDGRRRPGTIAFPLETPQTGNYRSRLPD